MKNLGRRTLGVVFLLVVACGPAGSDPDGGLAADGSLSVDAYVPPPLATGLFPEAPPALPFDYARADVGEPIPASELAAVTDRYLELLARTEWLDLVADRAHGWPESDPEARYWYATWWSGVVVRRQGGSISYVHSDDGADNNGLRTPQLLEGACYAWRLWGDPRERQLVRRLVRGLSSWHLAMRRSADDRERGLLSRAAYPPSIVDTARSISIVYDASRPGIDAEPSQYVHLPANPYWPDLWAKNTRSKDDMGHLLRTVSLLEACRAQLGEPAAEEELVEMRRLYQEWAQRVEADHFRIATLDASGTLVFPSGSLATYFLFEDIECGAAIAITLLSRGDAGSIRCPNGGQGLVIDPARAATSSALQILRSHHEAAAGLALLANRPALAEDLLGGLAARIDSILSAYERGETPTNANPTDIVQLVVESAILGVPLTSREVRWLHARIEMAHAGYDTSGPEWHAREPATPDGDYAFEPGGPGIDFKDLALLLGTCVGPWVNPAGRPVLDCDRVRAAARP